MKGPRRSSWWTAALLAAVAFAPQSRTEAQRALSSASGLEAGRLLVARPGMVDPNFSETVVLLLSYGEGGAMGVIVNRPTRIPLSEALPDIEPLAASEEVLFSGGPVAVNRLIFMLRAETSPAGCLPVLADVCAGGSRDALNEAFGGDHSVTGFRGFAGHAGWAPGQLEWEVQQRGWYVVSGDSERLFDRPSGELWSELVRIAESPMA